MKTPPSISRPSRTGSGARAGAQQDSHVHQSTRGRADQVVLALAAMLIVAGSAGLCSAAPAGQRNAFEQQLANECDALNAAAVKTSYGWGWSDAKAPAGAEPPAPPVDPKKSAPRKPPLRRPAKPVQIARRDEIDVRQTAAAGLVLYMAGEQLGDARLTRAATEAARALAAVQQPTGQMPAVGILGANAGGRDEPSVVPSRAATCAALALLSTVIQGSEKPDARLAQAATKAAAWLGAQQTPSGAWPVAHTPAGARGATRLIRLDTPDYRDATAALLLAAHALGDAAAAKRAEAAVTSLLSMRVRAGDDAGGVLWVPGYRLTGEPLPKNADLPYALDTVSAEYGTQTLLAACLLGTDTTDASAGLTPAAKAAAPALTAAAKALDALPRKAGGWHRYYDILAATPVAELEPRVGLANDGLFASDDDAAAGATADAAVLAEVIFAAKQIGAAGLEKFLADAEAENAVFWPPHRVSLMLCGLGHGALSTQFPAARSEVARYLKVNEGLWTLLEGAVPGDLPTRLERLQLLVVRSKLERVN
jgi:hypothetical protein